MQLVKGTNGDFSKFVAKRLQWWSKDDEGVMAAEDIPLAMKVVSHLKGGCRVLPQHICVAYLKSIANAWITAWRLSNDKAKCPYGCGHAEGGCIRHLLVCPSFLEAVKPYMPTGHSQWPSAGNLREALGLDDPPKKVMLCRLIWHDVAMHCSNIFRHNPEKYKIRDVVVARVRTICRESRFVRATLIEYKASAQPLLPLPPPV